jgi:dUTP pyrophosphatase
MPGSDPAVPLPEYQSAGAAGMDVHANLPEVARVAGLSVEPGERRLVPTGLRVELPSGHELQLRPRSGLALREGLTLLNSPGTIDSDYRGEIGVLVINHGRATVIITHGMRLAQLVLAPIARAVWVESAAVNSTARGASGFGSTGTGAGPRV